jgi:hypothetical protein
MATEKELKEKIYKRLASMSECSNDVASNKNPTMIGPLIYDTGALLFHLNELSELSSRRLERQTQQLVYLTWALVAFTAVLVVLTLILIKHG